MSDGRKITSRVDFLAEVKTLMLKHKLRADQVLYLLANHHGIAWGYPVSEVQALAASSKKLLKADGKTNVTRLWGKRSSNQLALTLRFESEPNGTKETLKLAERLKEQFIEEGRFSEDYVEELADGQFHGDIVAARYFCIFESLWPVKDKNKNRLWNKHFGIRFDGVSRWTSDIKIAHDFHKLYKLHDIGLLLSAVYYYVKDSVDLKAGEAFVSKPANFIKNHTTWLRYATEKFDEQVKKDADETPGL